MTDADSDALANLWASIAPTGAAVEETLAAAPQAAPRACPNSSSSWSSAPTKQSKPRCCSASRTEGLKCRALKSDLGTGREKTYRSASPTLAGWSSVLGLLLPAVALGLIGTIPCKPSSPSNRPSSNRRASSRCADCSIWPPRKPRGSAVDRLAAPRGAAVEHRSHHRPSGCGKTTIARHFWPETLHPRLSPGRATPRCSTASPRRPVDQGRDGSAVGRRLFVAAGVAAAVSRPVHRPAIPRHAGPPAGRSAAGACARLWTSTPASWIAPWPRSAAAALAKVVRQRGLRFIAVTCHDDVMPGCNRTGCIDPPRAV